MHGFARKVESVLNSGAYRRERLVPVIGAHRTHPGDTFANSFRSTTDFDFKPLLLIALAVFALRLPTIHFDVLNVDESVYHIMGAAWLNGTLPHVGIVDNKPLGLYFIHAVAQVLFRDPVVGARLLGALSTVLAAWLLMQCAQRYFLLTRNMAVFSGVLFATYAAVLGGDASQGPVFYEPMVVGGALLIMQDITALRQQRDISLTRLGAAGLWLGLSLQVKYSTVFECAGFGAFFLYMGFTARHVSRARVLAGAGMLVAGGLFPTAAALGIYALAGHTDAFIFYSFVSNLVRAPSTDPAFVLIRRLGLTWLCLAPLIILGARSLWQRWRGATGTWSEAFLVVWFASAALGGVAQMQFYDHYFYGVVPPLAVMATKAIQRRAALQKSFLTPAVLLLGIGVVAYGAVRIVYVTQHGSPYTPSRIAHDIGTTGAKSMYVFNTDGLLYFLANIPLPTRFPLPSHLLRDINSNAFGFDPIKEMGRILDGNQDVIVVDEPLTWRVSEDRREMLEAKLDADYCLWKRYQQGDHDINVYLMKTAHLRVASNACFEDTNDPEDSMRVASLR